MQLREYQKEVLTSLYSHFRSGKRAGYIFAPTGAGKTVIASQMVKDAIDKGRRVLFCVHRTKLVEQTAKTMKAVTGITPGIIAPGYTEDFNSPIQIGMLQTIQSRFNRKGKLPPDIGLVVYDECHISISFDIAYQLMIHYSGGIVALGKCFFVGLTATPWRTNPREGLCQYFQFSVKAPSPRQLINMGHLTRERIILAEAQYTGSLEVDEDTGDYSSKSLNAACGHEFNASVVKSYTEIAKDRKTIAFCVSVKASEDLCSQLKNAGYSAEVLTGATTEAHRQEIFGRFKYGITKILVSVGALTEGFDEPSLDCVLIARPTRSKALLIQMVGRGLRLHEGKEECLIIDCGDCFTWLQKQSMGSQDKDQDTGDTKKIKDVIDLDYAPLCPALRTPKGLAPDQGDAFKACSKCGHITVAHAAFCPKCGEPFKEKKKVATKFFLRELLSPEQEAAFKWLRKTLFNWFDKGKDLSPIFEKFKAKFGYLPPHDWFIGALFSFQDSSINAAIYTDKLRRANPRISDAVVSFMLRLEFGEPGRKYVLPDGEYCPKAHTVQAFNWWEYLGVKRFCTPDEIKLAYQERVMNDPCPEALNYALKTGLFVRGGK
jgi:superfamily II DNA or RNA helicase